MPRQVAVAIADRAEPHRLVLCAAYTSLREAAWRVGLPRWCALLLPAIRDNEAGLRRYGQAVVIVQGEADRLFPRAG